MDAEWMGGVALVALAVTMIAALVLLALAAVGDALGKRGAYRAETLVKGVGIAVLFIALGAAVVFVGLLILLAGGALIALLASAFGA